MTTQEGRDFDAWIRDWKADGEAPRPADAHRADEIRHVVLKRGRLLRWLAAGEACVAIFFFTAISWRALTVTDPFDRAAMIALLTLIVGVSAFGWFNWRGRPSVSGESTATFIAIALDRTRRFEQAIRTGWVTLVGEVVIFVPWIWHLLHGDGRTADPERALFVWSFLGALVAGGIAALLLMRLWVRRDARRFEALRNELGNDAGAD
jgi:hypothetical protein